MATTKTNRATLKLGRAIYVNGVAFKRLGRDEFEVTYPADSRIGVKPDLAEPPVRANIAGGTDPSHDGEPIPVTDPR